MVLATINGKVLKGLKKRDYKQHHKEVKALRKELVDMSKDVAPWDNWTINYLEIQIKYWVKYYSLGYNVWGMEHKDWDEDKKDWPTRLEVAKHLQILLYRYMNFGYGLTDEELLEYEFDYDNFMKKLEKDFVPSEDPAVPSEDPAVALINEQWRPIETPLSQRMKKFYAKYKYISDTNEERLDTERLNADYLKCKKELFDYYFEWADMMWD